MARKTPLVTIHWPRSFQEVIAGSGTRDGAAGCLARSMPNARLPMLNQFLLLDVFHSDHPDDYIAGSPPHLHRDFETVNYLLAEQVQEPGRAVA